MNLSSQNPYKNKILQTSFCIFDDNVSLHLNSEKEEFEIKFDYYADKQLSVIFFFKAVETIDLNHNLTTEIQSVMDSEISTRQVLLPKTERGTVSEFFDRAILDTTSVDSSKLSKSQKFYDLIIRMESTSSEIRSVCFTYFKIMDMNRRVEESDGNELVAEDEENDKIKQDPSQPFYLVNSRSKREIGYQSFEIMKIFVEQDEAEEKKEALCVICMAEKPDCIFFPCRHFCVDKSCAEHLDKRTKIVECPVCRKSIEEVIHISNINSETSAGT